jgi:hypothetical protein
MPDPSSLEVYPLALVQKFNENAARMGSKHEGVYSTGGDFNPIGRRSAGEKDYPPLRQEPDGSFQ